MISPGRILVVDDVKDLLETYRDILIEDGYDVHTRNNREDALAALHDNLGWDVVILDQKLLGPGGPEHGTELAREVKIRCPEARTLIITAYATADMIDHAFAAGIYDFLEKGTRQFEHLLRIKVRNALESTLERRRSQLSRDEAEARIVERWKSLDDAADSNARGRALEDLMVLLLRSIPGFRHITTNRKSDHEEFDIVIRNESDDSVWRDESQIILVECKNWSSKVDPREFNHFYPKLEGLSGRGGLGFFVAASGFTKGFGEQHNRKREKPILIVPIGPEELQSLVKAEDRNEQFKILRDRAAVEGVK